jgi:hypothetical protein
MGGMGGPSPLQMEVRGSDNKSLADMILGKVAGAKKC